MQSQSQFYVDELKSYFQQQDKQDIKFEETMQILKLDSESSINNYISNSQNRCQSNTNEINLKKKTIVFNKQFKRFKETQSQLLIQKKYTFEKDLRLSQGLLISTEGIIRTDYSIVQLSFGYLYNASIVKFLKKQYIVEVQYDQIQQNHEISLKDAYNYLCKTPCQQIQSSYYAIQSVYEQKRKLRTELDSIKITQDLIQLYNQQLYLFMQKCDAYIEQYNQQNDGAIFQYFIRKINLSTKTEEIAKVGYSKSFLDLIGASVDKFCSMLLINQQHQMAFAQISAILWSMLIQGKSFNQNHNYLLDKLLQQLKFKSISKKYKIQLVLGFKT
ncbi:hypothetical protein TTHERM_001372796 (macronuclear) [Tetrahymena thermophila SB210]|uniref:Uncharacterized protein n=1 Tax=Tetrahymena thermophila (strain SB210) TaxID=312017 RepID=W7X507_TETTS|nr:hypothetical protein TTHERM_001372796 [Tetrahymena thermophila SB210]EWS72502.1 hypothetical protein TTHERM_001372796 [Tetrahymena thermophila SB210]|eukprot:XP_012654962.1 hypothetical protein TTHERM_001372796 [Tetrahymena thermophila SB210]